MKWLLWWPIRLTLFLVIVGLSVFLFDVVFTWLDLGVVTMTVGEAIDGNYEALTNEDFAYSLATLIFAFGAGIAAAFLFANVAFVLLAVRRSRRVLEKAMKAGNSPGDKLLAYSDKHDDIRGRLTGSFFVGHAFKEFCETLVVPDERGKPIVNTVRPQSFINASLARERLPGLKIMPSIPGYFVGIGLLLTFIGLVLALSKAGEATQAGDADSMTIALNGLLAVASFKFATSIAGLGTSIFLAIFFRIYQVLLESSFGKFCETLENGLVYQAPQSISAEMSQTLKEQLRELKDITQGEFFSRMGREMEPIVARAVSGAMTPVGDRIYEAVGNISQQGTAGMEAMITSFSENVQMGAGAELKALAETLAQMEKTLSGLQNELRGSGEDVSRRLSEAAEGLKALVDTAGSNMEESSAKSRDAFAEIAQALKESLSGAGEGLNAKISSAADASARQIDETMANVLGRLDAQISQLGAGLNAIQETMASEAARTEEEGRKRRSDADALADAERERAMTRTKEWEAAQRSAQEGLAESVSEVAGRLTAAVEEATRRVEARFGELGTRFSEVERALAGQTLALQGTAGEARKTADAFSDTAQQIRVATPPLIQVSERFSKASDGINESLQLTLRSIEAAKGGIETLALSLTEANQRSGEFWDGFRAKFDSVDTALGVAVTTLSTATTNQTDSLRDQVRTVDHELAKAIGNLQPLLNDLSNAAGDLADSVGHQQRRASGSNGQSFERAGT
ncbi:hypothetical protein DYI37_17300 [Fulvimarina endophytica]|uniref:MotA/TolQ/ExbB proton channel domain-containing protein n=1 Tax=Fulvimarina endophytica TaxID=2293836 RepID=A0A371WZ40_9HYPH|nr:anti-phage ZorAB system protein ZorA [Fulvimarina endophytica]RFC62260.1 hypothetical protein DYI37_17300 [Fulvimarina endophytica]